MSIKKELPALSAMSAFSERVRQILGDISTANEAAGELYDALEKGDETNFAQIAKDLWGLLAALQAAGLDEAKANSAVKLGGAAESAIASLERITAGAENEKSRALRKLEFELVPFLTVMYAEYYFWAGVYPRKSALDDYYRGERAELYANRYIERAIRDGKYKYDLSLMVQAYNKLDYTRRCVNSLLANLPRTASWELILINNGSNDGTQEYFESVKPDKQLDIKVNYSLPSAANLVVEGEYLIWISNDTLIAPGAIDNMLRTLREDEKIGWVVPSTPNISNLQTIPSDYTDNKSFVTWAEANNIYDPYRHEVRTRLCNPIGCFRSSTYLGKSGIGSIGRYYTGGNASLSFPDDQFSMLCRRAGLKNVLGKDAYCHHFGSVTIKDDLQRKQTNEAEAYRRGRANFKNAFGIDPWGTGFCYDYVLAQALECKFDGHVEVLGINCGLGGNSLKIKELYKERRHNLDVWLTNVTDERGLIPDLRGVSDSAAAADSIGEVFAGTRDKRYHYIVFEDPFKGKRPRQRDLALLYSRLTEEGELYIKDGSAALNKGTAAQIGGWVRIVKGAEREREKNSVDRPDDYSLGACRK